MKTLYVKDSEIHKSFKIFCAKRGIKLYEALEEALRDYLKKAAAAQ